MSFVWKRKRKRHREPFSSGLHTAAGDACMGADAHVAQHLERNNRSLVAGSRSDATTLETLTMYLYITNKGRTFLQLHSNMNTDKTEGEAQ
jgi:hypothetical protein